MLLVVVQFERAERGCVVVVQRYWMLGGDLIERMFSSFLIINIRHLIKSQKIETVKRNMCLLSCCIMVHFIQFTHRCQLLAQTTALL